MRKSTLSRALKPLMIKNVPSYGNKFVYSLGFLSMISFMLLLITGLLMVAFGPDWWLTNGFGKYARGVHMWATQAFVVFIILHLLIVFVTSGFRSPRRLTWVLGVLMLFLVMAESEFGYVLRGDFSSQWRSLQGADFYNGAGLGYVLNALNYGQIYGVHIVLIPLTILGLLFLHYLLVRVLGIATPYKQTVKARTVPANHTKLFVRGGVLIVLVLALAVAYPSPFLKPTTIADIAGQDPNLMAKTLVAEFDSSSDTAGYRDNIAPYTYDVRQVYIATPYAKLVASHSGMKDELTAFGQLSADSQTAELKQLSDYYGADSQTGKTKPTGLAADVVSSLSDMAVTGLYESALADANSNSVGSQSTYELRFLSDTGALEDRATGLTLTTEQYGMLREETSGAPGAWWLAPIDRKSTRLNSSH